MAGFSVVGAQTCRFDKLKAPSLSRGCAQSGIGIPVPTFNSCDNLSNLRLKFCWGIFSRKDAKAQRPALSPFIGVHLCASVVNSVSVSFRACQPTCPPESRDCGTKAEALA